ncbi:MAG: hypothetical protein AUK47_04520, partial [Deltaproteobacteria bacterium CG2_30_63_29]
VAEDAVAEDAVAEEAVAEEAVAEEAVAEEAVAEEAVAEEAEEAAAKEPQAVAPPTPPARTAKRKPWEDEIDRIVAEGEAANDKNIAGARYIDAAERSMQRDGNYPRIPQFIERALELAGDRVEVLKVAANYYREKEQWSKAADLLSKLSEATTSTSAKIDVLGDLAQIYDLHLDNNVRAASIAAELLELDPTHPGALKAAEAQYSASGDWESLVKLYDKALKKMRQKPGEVDLLVGLATMVWKRIGDIDRAEGYYKRLKLADSKNRAMLDFYVTYYREKDDAKRLLTALQHLKAVEESPERQLAIAFQMAEVAEDKLDNPEKAIDVWKQLLRTETNLRPARKALAKLYEKTRKWNALLELIKEDINDLDEDEVEAKVELYQSVVEIYRDQLRLDVMVINTYNSILEVDPENNEAIAALAERYEKANRWNDLLGILTRKAESTTNVAEAVDIYWRIADLWRNKLGNTRNAISSFEKIVELDETHAESIKELRAIYEQRSSWAELFDILGKEAKLYEGDARVELLERQADIAEKRLRDQDKAIVAWEAVANATSAPIPALEKLEALYLKSEDHKSLVGVYERMLQHTEGESQIEVLDKFAQLYVDHLEDEEKAVGLWRQMIPIEGGQAAAFPKITEIYINDENWTALIELYSEAGLYEELYDILEGAAQDLFDSDEQVELYLKVAEIAESKLRDDDKVVAAYEAILGIDGTHVETARAVLAYYIKSNDAAKQTEANQIILAWTSDETEAFDLMREIGRLYQEDLSDLPHAFEWFGKAVRKRPSDEELRTHFQDLAVEAKLQTKLVEVYTDITQSGEVIDDETIHALWRTMARVSQNDLEDHEQAVSYWARLLEVDDDPEAIDALETLYEQLEEWEKLLSILERKEAQASSDSERIRLSFKRAEILVVNLERYEEAAKNYVGVLDVDPQNVEAIRGLKSIYSRKEDWTSLAEILQRELDLIAEDRPKILVELGDVYLHRLEEIDSAIDFYSQLLDDQENNSAAVERLETLLDFEEHRHRVARLLEPVYRAGKDWEGLARNLEIRMEELSDPLDRCALLWELFELRENNIADAKAAFDTVVRIFNENHHDERAWDEIERLAADVDAWPRVAELYEKHYPEDVGADPVDFLLLRRLATIYETRLENDESARKGWELILRQEEEDLEAISHLEAIYKRAGASQELVTLLEHKASLSSTPDDERKALYFEVARILEDVLGEPTRSVEAYRQVLLVDGAEATALEALERLYQQEEAWDDLVELLRQELTILDSPAKILDVRFKLGSVLEEQKQDLEGAIEAYHEVLVEEPTHSGARSASEALLVRLADEEGHEAAELRTSLTGVLESIYVDESHHEKLVGVLKIRLKDSQETLERFELNTRIARLLRDQLGDNEGAFDTFKSAIEEDLDNAELREEIETLASVLQRWSEVIELYTRCVTSIEDGLLRREVQIRIAQIHERELSEDEAAIKAYNAVLELDESDREALDSLERLHEQQANWSELVIVMSKKADLEVGDLRVELLRKVALIQDDALGHASESIRTYQDILQQVEGDAAALTALERLYLSTENWPELINIYSEMSRLAEDGLRRRELYFKMSQIFEEMLEEPGEAILLYHQALDLDPADSEALNALDRLYLQQDRHADLAEILQRKLDLVESDEERNEIEYRLGQLYQVHLLGIERAIEFYRSILEREPSHQAALEALEGLLEDEMHRFPASQVLEPIYENLAEWQKLVDLLELQLLDTQDPPARVDLLKRVALLRQTQISDADGAFEAWARAMRLEPQDDFRQQLEDLAVVTGDYQKLADVFKEVLPLIYDPVRMVSLQLRIAGICLERLEDEAEAESFYLRALEVQEDNDSALKALEALYSRQGQWVSLLGILERQLDTISDSLDRKPIMFRVAQIQEDMLEDAESAIVSYMRIVDIDEANIDALDALKRLYRSQERWIDLVELLNHELNFAQSADSIISIKFELAKVYEEQLNEDVQAVNTYREVLEIERAHPETIAALEAMFDSQREALTIAEVLEPIYRSAQSWEKLVRAIEVRVENSFDETEKSERLSEVMTLWEEKLARRDKAFEIAGRLFLAKPSNPNAQVELKRLAITLNEVEAWANLFAEALKSDQLFDFSERKPIMLELAEIQAERLNQHEEARKTLEDVLLEEPSDATALDRLEWSYNQLGEWALLIQHYNRVVELSVDADERIALLFKISLINEEILNEPEAAIEAYQRVLEVQTENMDAIRALERMYRQSRLFSDLAQLYRREMDFTLEPDQVVELHHKLGTVLNNELNEIADAIDSYRMALEVKPEHPASRRSLESMLRELKAADEDDRRHQLQIALLLEPLYDDADWLKLVDVYEVQLEHIEDALSRVAIMTKEAKLYEEHDRTPERAFRAYARAFEENPTSSDVRAELERLAEGMDTWSELVPIYLRGIERCEDEHELVNILLRIAQLNEEEIGDTENAILCYQQILDHEPSHAVTLEALERLYLQTRQFKELVGVLSTKADNLTDIWERKDAYYRVADIWEEMLESPNEAIQTYRTILDIDDEDETALEALERLYLLTQDWVSLVGIYRQKIELAEDDDDRVRLQFAMASLYDEHIEDPNEAIEAYRAILSDHPKDMRAVESLDRLYYQQEMWVDLLDILSLELDIANGDANEELINRTEFRIGRLLETQLDDVSRAIGHYETILQRDPQHPEAFDCLEQLLQNETYRSQAAGVLEPLYQELGHWDRLVDLYEIKLEQISDPFDRRELMLQTAQIQEEKLENLQMAFMLLGRATREHANDETVVDEFERLAGLLGAWEEYVAVYEELIDGCTDPNLLLILSLRCARQYEEHLNDQKSAISKYQRVLEIDEFHMDALSNLDRLYQMAERWDDLASVLERRIEVDGNRDNILMFRYQLGYLKENVFEDLRGAIDNYRQILWDEPRHEDALEALERLVSFEEHRLEIAEVLEPLFLQSEDWGKLFALLGLKLEVTEDPTDRANLLRRLGRIAKDNLQDADRAFEAYTMALEIDAEDPSLIIELEGLAEALGNWSQLAQALDQASAKITDPINQKDLNLKIAKIFVDRLGDAEAAEKKYQQVLQAEPDDLEALRQLERIYETLGRWDRLLEIFKSRIQLTYDEDVRKEMLYRCADVALNTIRDDDKGIEFLEQILELDDTETAALDALDQLFEQKGRWAELVGILERKVEMSMEGGEMLAIHIRIGQIAGNMLNNSERAIEAFHSALDFDGMNLEILQALEQLYVSTERWSDLQQILMRELGSVTSNEQRLMLHMKCAALAEAKFSDSATAIENLQQVLMIEPSNDDALSELERIYADEGRFDDLIAVLNRQKEIVQSTEEQIALNIRIAQVAGTHLGDHRTAIQSLRDVLAIQPDNVQAIGVLAGLYQQIGDFSSALELLNDQLQYAENVEQSSQVLVKIGTILMQPGGDETQAEEAFVQALQQDGSNAEAIQALLTLYEARGDHANRLRVLEYRVATLEAPEERRALLIEIATTAKTELGDFATAARTLEQVFQHSPEDIEIAEQLLDAYIKSDNIAKAQPLLADLITKLEEARQVKRLPPFHHMKGQLALKAGDEAAALESFQAAYAINATYLPNLLDLGKYYYNKEEWPEALKIFQTMLLHQMNISDQAMKVDIFYHLGMVRMHSGDPRRARDMFNRALSIQPDHAPSMAAVEAL